MQKKTVKRPVAAAAAAASISLASLAPNSHVRVRGRSAGGGTMSATRLERRSATADSRVELRGPVNPGDDVTHAGTAIGTVAGIATGTPTLALAVLPLDAPSDALAVSGSTARAVPMLDGLAR